MNSRGSKKKMVAFRVSDDELETLRRACAHEGARSVSEYARVAIFRMAIGAAEPRSIDQMVKRIERKLSTIQGLLKQSLQGTPERKPQEISECPSVPLSEAL